MKSDEFVKIRISNNISDPCIFTMYLKEVFKDLSEICVSRIKKGISQGAFHEYFKLPVIISEKLFSALDTNNDGYLNGKEFVNGLYNLYFGNLEKTVEIIFNMLDFNHDQLICKCDLKFFLSYLPCEKSINNYKIQFESLDLIDKFIYSSFPNGKDVMSSNDFKNSEIYLQIYEYLCHKKPFNEESIRSFKIIKSKTFTYDIISDNINLINNKKRLRSNCKKSELSPIKGCKGISSNNRFENYEEITNVVVNNSRNDDFNSVTQYHKINKNPEISTDDNPLKLKQFDRIDQSQILYNDNNSIYEDWIYKLTENLNLKEYWMVLNSQNIYYYKNRNKEDLLGMHNLSRCFLKDTGEKIIFANIMHSFSISFQGKVRNYLCETRESATKWVYNLKKMTGYSSLFDYYEVQYEIGHGKFGTVKSAVNKKTNEKVAIKIINKGLMKNSSDNELVKTEIDIMKICQHKNIVKLHEYFENGDFIFIVMEYLSGGDLSKFLTKIKFMMSEEQVMNIIYQIAQGLNYLHQFGIIHRDLKPENILLTESSPSAVIKIMDFGLSKIVGPSEKVSDGYGTLSFVAPEVLTRQPYDSKIDVWSLGVTLYYMLSGTLPFDSENDNESIIAQLTVFSEVSFPEKFWNKRSNYAKELIAFCLTKDPKKRCTIDEFIQHPWFKSSQTIFYN